MARPGFALEVDERTPPLVVCNGDSVRMQRFPLGTRVIYPAEPLPPVPDLRAAIEVALDDPLDSEPLRARLRPGMRLTVAFDDITTPVPRMRQPDVRGQIIEAVLTRAASAGVDDVALVAARGLHRRMTQAELHWVLGERVFRSFFADGLLTNHDAEATERLVPIGATGSGQVAVNARVAESDLLVFVRVVTGARGGGAAAVAAGLGSTATISQLAGLPGLLGGETAAAAVGDEVDRAMPTFFVDAVLDNAPPAGPLHLLGKREWEWSIRDRVSWAALHRGLGTLPARARRQLLNTAVGDVRPIAVHAGAPEAVRRESLRDVVAQQVVEVEGQADVGILGVPHATPFSVDSVANPLLTAWMGLGALFSAHTAQPFVRPGGALILYAPMKADFSPLHHPSYVDFFAEVLPKTTDPLQIEADIESVFAGDSWYRQLYQTSFAFHGVHPCHLWYESAGARLHCGDIIWVGADRTVVERLGFRAASTLADALEIVAASVGRSPRITYLHNPPSLIADVK